MKDNQILEQLDKKSDGSDELIAAILKEYELQANWDPCPGGLCCVESR